MKRIFTSLMMVLGFVMQSQAQMQNMNSACEQNPCNALPVCATTVTNPYSYQSNTGNPGVAATGCGNSIGGTVTYAQNWMYYRFTCQTSGTLNFTITPNDPSSDLDWAMWNTTVSGCGGIATGNLVECNSFAGLGGTGMQAVAAQAFEPQITLVAGNTYVLGISRRSGGTNTTPPSGPPFATGSAGFAINFAGTANIVNSTAPALQSVIPYDPCSPLTQLKLKLTQPVRCFQIGAGDFSFTGGGTVPSFTASGGTSCPGCTGTTGFNWSNVSDTITINFSSPLPAGNYTISLVGVNPFSSLCGVPSNTAITLPLQVSANLNDSVRTGFVCATQTYIDTIYGVNGVSPYQFKSQGPGQSNTYGAATSSYNVFTGLTGGNTYTLSVKDATGCIGDTVISHAPYINMGLSTYKKDPPCTNQFTKDTFRVVNTTGGAAPFTYTLNSTPASASVTAVQYAPGAWNNLQQGSFTITCTDKWGCTATASANIANPPVVTFPTPTSTNPACFGDSTGTITVNASGGSGVMSYTISPTPPTVILPAPGYFTQVIGGLPGAVSPGITYTITVADVNGCSATNTRTLTTPASLAVSTAAATKVNPTCTNPCGGTYTPVASGGTGGKKLYRLPLVTPPNTYTDSVTTTGGTFQNLCQGTYTIRCVDVLGCNTTVTITLTLPAIPDIVNNSITNVTCFGSCNGQILNTTTGGTTPYTYTITPNNNPPCGNAVLFGSGGDYQNLPAGTYKVVVSSPNSCKDSVENLVITQPAAITWNSVTPSNILCFGNNTGSIAANASGGTGTISYTITPLGPQLNTSGNFANLTAQQYTITATDASGCTTTTTVLLTQPANLLYSSASFVAPSCNGATDGSITVVTTGGTPTITYTINPNGPASNTTGIFTGLPAATYTVLATDANGCTKSTTLIMTQPAPIIITSATFVSPLCFGDSNGTATIVATGGFGTKTYTISPLGPQSNTTGSFTGLTAQVYTITVTDANSCSTTTSITVVQPTALNFLSAGFTQPSCGGNSNGTITASASGGTGTKTYTISPLGPQSNTTGNFTGLTAQTYTVTVTDANACSSTTTVTVTQPTPLIITSALFTQPLCFNGNNGTMSVTTTGGTGSKTYTITPLGPQSNTTGNFSNLTAQSYTVTATDINGCSSTSVVLVTQPTQVTFSSASFVQPLCNGAANGTATAAASGGTGIITYTISPLGPQSNTTGNFSNLSAQTYTITGTDANGCTRTTTITITQPTALTFSSASFVAPLCNGNANGTIASTATGGTGTKTYTISPLGPQSNTTGNFTALTAQTYTVTCTDNNGCTTTTAVTVTQPAVLNITGATVVQPLCNGNSNGTMSVTATGGTGTKTYTISPLGPQSNTTGNFTGLSAQTYTVTVTDVNGCTSTSAVVVAQPAVLAFTSATFVAPLCFGNSNGTIASAATGGTGTKTYTISPLGPQSNTTGNFTGLTAQTYTITVTDANACTATTTVVVTQPAVLAINSTSFTQPLCFGNNNGTITAVASGGTNTLTYTINPLGPQSNTTGNFSNLTAQTYTVTVTDANLCTKTSTVVVTQPTALTFSSASFVAPLCNGNANGTIASSATGGTGTKTYTISPLGPQSNTTGNFTGLTAQTYTVTCTDNNGCTTTTAVTVTQPAVLNITGATVVQPLCNGNSNGTMSVTATGGTGTKTYTISPLGPQSNTTGNFTGLSAQTYTVTVTDVNGCTSTSAVVVAQPAVLAFTSATFVAPLCFGNSNGTIASAATGGTGTKTYTISPLGPQSNTTGNFTGLTAQTYTITVTDANACTATTTVVVTQPAVLAINSTSFTQPLCFGNNNGTITAVASGGTNTLTYTINPLGPQSNTTGNFSNLTAQTYTVTVTDANLCTKTSTVVVTQPTALTFSSASFVAPLCNGNNNGTITATASGGTSTITYTINPLGPQSNTTGNFSNLTAQGYTITATDVNGCTTTTAVTVTQPAVLNITGATVVQPLCFGNSNGTMAVTASGGTGTKTYTISPLGPQSNTTGNFTGLSAQTYTVTVTDVNGCTSTSAVIVNEPLLLDINSANFVSPLCFGNNNGSITSSATGGTGTKTFTISPLGPQSNTTGNFSNLTAQTYTITVTDANACTATSSVIVTQPTQLVVNSASFTQPLCNGSSNGTANVVASGGTNTLTYTITPLGPQSNITGNFSNLTAQCYTVTVTDANACTKTTTFCVTQPTAVVVNVTGTTSPTCTPGCDGTITVSASGGTGVISLASAPVLTQSPANTFIGACAATAYVVTATDVNGCTANTSTSLSTPNAPTPVAVALTNVSCNSACDGTAQVTIVAGITYTILPNNPGQNFNTTTGAVSGLCAGTYTVSATNALSCVGTTTFVITQPAALTLAINTSVNPNCVPGCNGTATVTAAGGNGTNVFTIAPSGTINATTGNASALCAGTTYTITVTDVKGCTSTTTITPITPASPSFVSASFTQPLCNGNTNGTITSSATGGTGTITYTITPSGPQSNTTGNFSNLGAQTYTITATDVNGCTTTTAVVVTQPNVLAITSVNFTQPSCNGGNNGTVTIVATGGTGTKTYTISPLGPQSNTTGICTGLTAQTYTVTVTDANNCTATSTVVVTQPTAVTINITGTTSPTCTPGCDGTITVSANGGTNPIGLASAPVLTQLPANTFTGACAATNYVITATDANGCTANTSTTLTTPNAPTPVAVALTNVSCNGQCNGTAQVTIVAGITYTILPNNPGQNFNTTTGAVSGLCAGTYTVSATNALSCVGTTTFVITQPAALTLAINTSVNPNCVPGCNGTATVTAAGGNGTNVFTIAPSGTINATTGNASALCAGTTYTITVTDVKGCTSTTTITPITPASPSFVSASFTQPLCNGNTNGTITSSATGGTGTITYTITPSGPQSNTTGNFSNLGAQTYTITATDVNGCTTTTAVVVTQPNVLAITSVNFTQPSCNGGNNGTVTIVATGGTGTKTYTISPLGPQSNTTGICTGLTAQTYTVTVTDANNCTATSTVVVTQPTAVTINITGTTSPTCIPGCDGTITVSANGGTNPIGLASAPVLTQLPANTFTGACAATNYVITATDANGCTANTSTTLTTPNAPTPVAVALTNVSCNGQCNGTAQVTIVAGITYTILPNNPGQNFNTTTGAVSGLCAGTYTVSATNALSCVGTTTFVITQPAALTLAINTSVNPNCVPGCNGTATVTAAGGNGTNVFTIAPSGTINATTGNASALCAGTTYTITVTDVKGCTSTTTITPTTPASPSFVSASFTQPLCNGNTNGTITSSATGGTGTITYTITPSGPQSNTTGNFSNLGAQTYTITATDVNGCTTTTAVIVTQPNVLAITSANFTQPLCNGLSNGTVTIVATGGTGTKTYTISPLGPQSNTTGIFSNLSAQCYTVTVTDANNCTTTTSVCVTQPSVVAINVTGTTSPTCTPGCDGSITVSATGGTGTISLLSAPFLTQSPASTFINACAATNYVITATDANGCTANTSTTLTTPNAPTPVAVALTNVSCNGQCNGTAQVTIVAGITYTISPNNPGQNFNTTTGAVSGLCAGTYTVSATNALSCVGTTTFVITQPAVLTLAVNTTTNPTCNPGCNGTATFTSTGGNGTNVYTIAPSGTINASNGNASALCAGTTYTITVTDVKGCTSTVSITPATPTSPAFTSANFTQPLCNGNNNGTITVTATGNGTITYTITPLGPQSNTTGTFNNLTAQSYTVTATTANGCTATTTVIVTQPNILAFSSANFTQPSCNSASNGISNNGTITCVTTGGTGTKTYTITPLGPQSNTTGNFSNLTAQCYTITVTDANNCTKTTSVCVTQPTAVAINVTGTTSPTCTPGCDGTITVSANGGTGTISLLSAPFLTQSPASTFINACAATNYVITATDANGCSRSTSTTLSTPNAPTPAAVTVTNATCNGQCNGTAQVTIVPNITYVITPSNVGQNFNPVTGAVSGLCAGTYTVTATNALSCIGTTTFIITQPTAVAVNITGATNPTSPLVCNGSAQANGSGGTGVITYTISAPGVINANTGAISALCDGCYTVTATDANSCTATTSFCVAAAVATLTANVNNIANATCFNTCNGTAQAGAVGGVQPYTYSISPTVPSGAINATTGAITGLCAGTIYTVTVTDAVSTTATVTVSVTQPTQVNIALVSTTQASCSPGCDAVAVVSANGGTPGYVYSIAPTAGITQNPAGTFTGLCSGTAYVVTATDANGCTRTVNVNITTQSSPTPVANVLTNVTCFGLCNGTAQVTTVPGVTYTVAGPGTPAINGAGAISSLCAGTYTVTATNAAQCTGTTTIIVTQPTQLTLALTTSNNPTCNPGCDGTATFTAAGGVGTNVYSIAPATGTINASNGNASTLCAGTTYTVTVTNANGCTATSTVLLSVPGSPTVNITSSTPPTCVPGCDGGATTSAVAGGVYSILPASGSINASTGIASNLCANITYTITVANASNCTAQTTVTLTTPGSPSVTIANTTTPSCVPGCDGTATPNPQAGLTYTILPSGTINAVTGVASNLCAGTTYTIKATDANGCTGQTTVNLTAPVPTPISILSSTQPNCVPGCNGTATTTAVAGAVYTIAPSGTINSNTGAASNLCAGITYTITATTSNGCSATTSVIMNTPANPTVSISAINNPTGPANCNGTLQATGAGGLAPYTYTIAGSGTPNINANTGAASNLCGSCYTITVTDANGCTATTTTCLINPLSVTAVGNNVSCFGSCNGTGQATAVGGSQSGYTYAITGGATINSATGAITNLCAGTIYTITATDLNSATATTTLQVSGPTQLAFNAATTTSPTCNPGCDGTISIAANGGTPGYTYTLASPAGMNCIPTQATPGNFNNLGAGTYTVTVTDANGCTKTSTVVVTPSGVPVINSVTGTNPLCNNQCNGTVTTNATGATSYTLTPGNITNATGSFNSLCAGTYTVTVSNAAGCTATSSVTLNNPSVLTVNTTASTNVACNGQNTGTITYNVTGGTGAITYTSNPALVGAGGNYPNVGAGTYTITAADVNNCSVSHVFTITQPSALTINSVSVASPLCSNQSNGVITLNISGGTGLYSATTNPVSSSVGPAASPLVINGLSPLTYTVTVADANNCTVTSAVTVPGSVPIVINSVNVTAPLCNTSCNGVITVAANGGNGTLTYTINPSGPAANTNGLFNNVCGGNYTVTVTDVNTCTQTSAVTVTPPPVLTFTSVSSTNPLCFGNNNGTISVTSAGGTGLKVYSITPASSQPTPGNFTGLTAQTYTVVVTDANNCSTSTVITLTNPSQLVWNNPTSTNVTCFGSNNGTITSPATGGTGTKTYSIAPAVQASNTTGLFTNLSAQCYTITVADVQGCTLTRVVCITQPPAITFNQPTVVNVLCFGAATGSISITANGGTPTYTYALTPANGTQTTPGVFDNLLAGTYAVTVTDANGCTASTTNILIAQPPAITFTSVNVQNVACFGDATGSISVTAQGGVGAIQFNMQPSGNQASPGFFNGLYAGTYTVSATDGNNCVVTTVVTVGSNPQLKLNNVMLTEPICFGDNNGAIAATAIGGVAPIQYSLNNSPFQNNGTFNNLYAGFYIMTLRDAIGCMEDTLLNLTQPTEVGAKVETTPALCVDSKDGKVKITGSGGRGGYKYYITPGLYINKSGVFSGLAIGTYTLRVVDTAGCEYRNVFTINPPSNPLGNYMTKKDLGCFGIGNEGQATANVLGGTPPYNFLWNTSPVQTTATASTLYFGLYKVQITDANGCAIKDSVYIAEGPCCDVAFIPNAFSPNGDGNNDEFRILTSAGVELQQLEIFNRWGQSVWKSNDVHRAWNGYISGQEAPMDTYYYVLRYKCTRDNETYTKKGDVILVR